MWVDLHLCVRRVPDGAVWRVNARWALVESQARAISPSCRMIARLSAKPHRSTA
jgi:hypothetical protein